MSTKILIEGTTEAAWWRLVIERDGATISETCFDFAHAHRRAAEIMGIAEPASRATDDTVNGLMTAGATPAQVIDALAKEKAEDGARLGWLLRNVSGKEWSRLGIIYSAGCTRADIDDAMLLETGVAR